ncbi:predicted protein [Nematostella vectensis]|uniref:BHLH domain-containing protein n=1 Tax=Nematostella vectensis TaxID=45351 RepID=A7RIE4_NEMVE|nr:predicted protein [Nematostella vectensis]|eukprot:XP_001640859.1 predicted protein [Nematostella vectensis]
MTLVAEHLLMDTFGSDFDSLPPSLFKDFPEDGFNMKKKSMTSIEEDIMSDYSFPPTPPISPGCSSIASEIGDPERIQPVCDELEDDFNFAAEEKSLYFQENDFKDILIKDCMWNGAAFENADKKHTTAAKQKVNTSQLEKIRLLCQTPPIAESTARVLSVDPAEIFPFPINADSTDGPKDLHEGSDSEEEVDVVTIEHSAKKEGEVEKPTADDVEMPETPDEILPSPSPSDASTFEDFDDDKTELTGKIKSRKSKKSYSHELSFYKQGRKSSKTSNSGSGDSDESENDSEYTRATHNVLERKRRNDLKLKFQKLRDAVPELKDNERAPKVSILRKSWEHIVQLKEDELKLVAEFEKQKKINALLLKKLLSLNKQN